MFFIRAKYIIDVAKMHVFVCQSIANMHIFGLWSIANMHIFLL